MRARLIEIRLVEHPEADAFALRRSLGGAQRQGMMAPLFGAAKMDCDGGLVRDLEPDDLRVEVARLGEVARGQHDVARARDVERRGRVGWWKHCAARES